MLFAVAMVIAGIASAAKYPVIKVDDDPSVGKDDAPLVLIEFGHHL